MLRLVLLASVCVAVYCQVNPGSSLIPCGTPTVQPVRRIVGGQPAIPNSWPWTALIVDGLGFIAGTGTIIHPNVIVTTAQHFESPGFSYFDHDVDTWTCYAGSYNISLAAPTEKAYHIRKAILHPGYNVQTLENDIALIITSTPITYNDATRPLCLPDATHKYHVGEMCYLAGWGSTRGSGNEESQNFVGLPILADSVCQGHWQGFLPNTEVCAGYENGHKDFCGDDLGGALACKDQNGAWYIQGIASSGGNCTLANEPGIFEDVSQYSDWIKQTMKDAGYRYQY